jgi:NAD(P)H-binding
VRGQDAVIDAIGGSTPYKTTLLESTSVRSMIDAMKSEGVRRLIVISMMRLGEQGQAPFWYKYLLDADVSARIDQGQDHDGKRGHPERVELHHCASAHPQGRSVNRRRP